MAGQRIDRSPIPNIFTQATRTAEIQFRVAHHDGDLIDPASNIKENNMITKLRTPSETIARKDLIVALLISDSRAEDEVMHAVALVQDLAEGESITRGYSLKKQDVVGKFVQIVDLSIDGVCTDFVPREMLVARSDQHQLVLDGVIINVPVSAFVIVSEAPRSQKLSDVMYHADNNA